MSTNPYKLLRELLPEAPLQVGSVESFYGGVYTLALDGGGRTQARGTAEIGDRVFFRDGAIQGPAPTLPLEEIEV